jgi:hypothetical protein
MPESVIRKYYEALGQGELWAKKCPKCGAVTFPPTTACENCGDFEQDWVKLSGQGKLLFLSHGMAPPPNPRFAEIAPYAYGHVRLEEGVYVQAIITGIKIDPDTLRGYFEKGPVAVVPDILNIQDLNILAFKEV